ncbi:URC4/urg3 family protein [Mastigocoleus testarum]|uniref:Uracil phosphoribosyltransferase n=1 Tax=Mastigocoleus testarum BC008 TaxID=371196 RepID=A0A0V7ZUF4_9CYAN|nr:URC4/urg3 family protein [Mastigocoleus testarum]KST64096.1 uracil phosphoribosyltransferase [Mastigocoleus testarum BC008]KST68284.1 uracil phosphoribosyltransferase [Mastigocoleus testarum BC008]
MNQEIISTPITQRNLVAYLRSPIAIRERCQELFAMVLEGNSSYFTCNLDRLGKVADYVIDVMHAEYPDLHIPFHSRWRHFEAGGIERLKDFDRALAHLKPTEKAVAKLDLAILSILLDAGAGSSWVYYEESTGSSFKRSEGLAIASLHMFCQGSFSSDRHQIYCVDARKLQALGESELATGFQVSSENYLVGFSGRLKLLQKLGRVLLSKPEMFGATNPRPGNLVHYLSSKVKNNKLAAASILEALLEGFSDIWPGRLQFDGVNLGDVWSHRSIEDDGFVPFHKLSQWLTYSLLEPLQELGWEITGLDDLTGLPEYRNGGLCIDLGLIEVKRPNVLRSPHPVSSEVIVEWRALTVVMLDRIAAKIREKLDMTSQELPLVKILQGGTWLAGRKIASELRTGGIPPIQIESDGTVF